MLYVSAKLEDALKDCNEGTLNCKNVFLIISDLGTRQKMKSSNIFLFNQFKGTGFRSTSALHICMTVDPIIEK